MSIIPSKTILINPLSLFQIIKDIQMGSGQGYHDGVLYGMPADPSNPQSSIEVTNSYPTSTSKFSGSDLAEAQRAEARKAVERDLQNHLKLIHELGFDDCLVGYYTSRNFGRCLHFEDIKALFEYQSKDPSSFYLVVDLSSSSISVRAFRIAADALNFVAESGFDHANIESIPQAFFFKNFVEELKVNFALTPLDEQLLKQMLTEFNLVADVFKLRDLDSVSPDVTDVAASITQIDEHAKCTVKDNAEIEANHNARKEWIERRKADNLRRAQKHLDPLPLEEVDMDIPKKSQCDKKVAISDLYQYQAKASALAVQLEDEKTKHRSLIALSHA